MRASRTALLISLLGVASELSAAERLSRTQILMGDVPVSITIETSLSRRENAFMAMGFAFDEAQRIEGEVSEWRPESQTSLLNQNAGRALVPIGRDLLTILMKASEVSRATHGSFDITFPSKNRLLSYEDVIVLPELGLAALRSGVTIAVSGIAKGYIVDAMKRVLQRAGFTRFLVNAGDIYAAGRWQVAIRDPEDPGGDRTLCRLTLRDQAVSTSGPYERGGHIIDPENGRPVHSLKSLTVVTSDSMTADALATGLFVLGVRGTASLSSTLRNLKGVGVVSVDSGGGIELFGGAATSCRP